jgi:electron transfer flavoprotein alpha subunit
MDFSYLDDWTEEEESKGPIEEVGEGYRNVWVVAQCTDATVLPDSLAAVGQARELADQIGVYVYGLLLGTDSEPMGKSLIASGADKVLVANDPALAVYQPGVYVHLLADLVNEYRPEILLMSATPQGNDLAPRLAQRLNTGLVSHCVKLDLDMSERLLLGTYAVLGGEMFHTAVCPESRPQMATLQPGFFHPPYEDDYRSGEVQSIDADIGGAQEQLEWLSMDATIDLPARPLSGASVIVSAGRGMGDADGFALVEELARALNGTVAGSRGAYDEGWIGEEQIVGVGGTFVAPDLYVACGVSGDIYHTFGLQEAKFTVAINLNADAPIMKSANMAIVGDARKVIPAMLEALSG